MADELEFKIRFRLADYLAVQGWCLTQYLWWRLCIFLSCTIAAMIVIGLMDGLPLDQIFLVALYDWRLSVGLIVGVFALICFLPFFVVVLVWLFRRVPKENKVKLSRENVTFSSPDYSLGAPWPKVSAVLRTRSSYVIRTKKVVMRLPLRELSDSDKISFEALIKQYAPAAAIKF